MIYIACRKEWGLLIYISSQLDQVHVGLWRSYTLFNKNDENGQRLDDINSFSKNDSMGYS